MGFVFAGWLEKQIISGRLWESMQFCIFLNDLEENISSKMRKPIDTVVSNLVKVKSE